MILDVTIPGLRVNACANRREHWAKRARRVRRERDIVHLCVTNHVGPSTMRRIDGPLVVTFTRIGVRPLDDDNLANAFKSIRDEVAALLGRDDNPRSGITWRYEQTRGRPREYAVRIRIERADEVAP